MRGDNQLPRLVDGVDDAGQEIGEGFADAGAGLEQQRLVGLHRGGHRAGHLLLFRAVLELQSGLQPAALGEDLGGEFGRATGRRGRRSGVGFVAKANHETEPATNEVGSGWCK